MAEPNRPVSPEEAADPSDSYERAHPEHESAEGRLDGDKPAPQNSSDKIEQSAPNRQNGARQVNAHDAVNQRGGPAPAQPGVPKKTP